MQPSTPWTPDTNGGLITLQEPITRASLLAGKLIFRINTQGSAGERDVIPTEVAGNLVLSLDGDWYRFVDPPSGSYAANELVLQRSAQSSNGYLVSVRLAD